MKNKVYLVIFSLLFPCLLFSQSYNFSNAFVKVNLELQKETKDSLVTGIVTIQNIYTKDILVFKNDANNSSISPKVLIIDFSTKITDPALIKKYQIPFFYLKPQEMAKIEKKNKFDWKQLENINILLNIFEVSKLDSDRCNNQLNKSLKKQTNQLSLECFQAYQEKNGLGEIFIKFKTSNVSD